MRNLPSAFHEEDIELGQSSLSYRCSAPNVSHLSDMTDYDDDPGGEYQRMEEEEESGEWMESRNSLLNLDRVGDGCIDWDSYREAMVLGGEVLNKDQSTSFDKFRLLNENCKLENEIGLENCQYQISQNRHRPNDTLVVKPGGKCDKSDHSTCDKMCQEGQECDKYGARSVLGVKEDKFVNYDEHTLLQETCDCRNRKPEGLNGNSSITEVRISRPSSVNQRLRRNSLLLGPSNKKEQLDNIFTKILILVTVFSILFLFWLQNSPFHIGHIEPSHKLRLH